MSLDEGTPRLPGLDTARGRLGFLAPSVLPSATAVAAAGAIGFVGLVASHAARALVGRRHVRVVPVAVLLGAVLVCAAELVGRTVIAAGPARRRSDDRGDRDVVLSRICSSNSRGSPGRPVVPAGRWSRPGSASVPAGRGGGPFG